MDERASTSREHALNVTELIGFEVRVGRRRTGEVAGTTYDAEHAYIAVDGDAGRVLMAASDIQAVDRDNQVVQVFDGAATRPAPDEAELLGPAWGEPEEREGDA